MSIRQDRYVVADTNKIKKVDIIEVPQIPDDPVLRRSDIQQQVNNSTLPVSSRAVNLAIVSINNDLGLKADKTELEGLATEDYVNEKIDEKEVGITEPELIGKSVGSGKWLREGSSVEDSLKTPGIYYTPSNPPPKLMRGMAGVTRGLNLHTNNPSLEPLVKDYPYLLFYFEVQGVYGDSLDDILTLRNMRGEQILTATRRNPEAVWTSFNEVLGTANTFPDSNGVLHNSSNPIDTLNTSDMADTVVDNDLLTVTSGAVFRAIKQLTDQIISLETRVRELEDGGV